MGGCSPALTEKRLDQFLWGHHPNLLTSAFSPLIGKLVRDWRSGLLAVDRSSLIGLVMGRMGRMCSMLGLIKLISR